MARSTDCPNVAIDVPSAQASGTFTQSLTLTPVTHLPPFRLSLKSLPLPLSCPRVCLSYR